MTFTSVEDLHGEGCVTAWVTRCVGPWYHRSGSSVRRGGVSDRAQVPEESASGNTAAKHDCVSVGFNVPGTSFTNHTHASVFVVRNVTGSNPDSVCYVLSVTFTSFCINSLHKYAEIFSPLVICTDHRLMKTCWEGQTTNKSAIYHCLCWKKKHGSKPIRPHAPPFGHVELIFHTINVQ